MAALIARTANRIPSLSGISSRENAARPFSVAKTEAWRHTCIDLNTMETTSTAVWQSDSIDRKSNPEAAARASIPVLGSYAQESEQGSGRKLWAISFSVWTLLAF